MATAAPSRSLETVIAILVALNLSFLPWAFGGVDAWSQCVSLTLALASFSLALRVGGWRRLRAFPVFWAGGALLGYVAVQTLNPAFQYVRDDASWWLVRVDHAGWLPAGMDVPFASNGWRTIVVWATCWLMACAIWIGTTRKASLVLILNAICANALVLAVFGLLQRLDGATEIYGSRGVRVPYFFAAFIYKHHAAAYFSLLACTAIGLALHSWRSDPRKTGLAIAQTAGAVVFVVLVALTFSFSGLFLLGLALLGLATAIVRELWLDMRAGRKDGRFLAAVLVLGGVAVTAGTIGQRDFREKVQQLAAGDARQSVKLRALAARSGLAMFQDRWATGWGAGCFSYGFTKYQKPEPELARWQHLKLRWEHLHNDWLQLLIELGVVGALPVVVMAWFWIGRIIKFGLWRDPLPRSVLTGVTLVAIYGLVDFPLQNPAVLLTTCALLTVAVRRGEVNQGLVATA